MLAVVVSCSKTEMWNPVGEYCVHGFEAFPGWHRACASPASPAPSRSHSRAFVCTDLLEFERVMRRADMALGGDGSLGLPYWGWDEVTVNDETFPKILRERFEECKSPPLDSRFLSHTLFESRQS